MLKLMVKKIFTILCSKFLSKPVAVLFVITATEKGE